jgi:hypothetical protein
LFRHAKTFFRHAKTFFRHAKTFFRHAVSGDPYRNPFAYYMCGIFSFVPGSQNGYQKCRQISSKVKFA